MFEFLGLGKKVEQEKIDLLSIEKSALQKLAENNATRQVAADLFFRSTEYLKQNIS